jgi:hypothetical protein
MTRSEPFWKSRTLMTFIAIAVMWGLWERASAILSSIEATKAAPFESLTQTAFWTISLLVAALAGIKGVERIFAFKREAVSQTVNALEQVIERTPAPKHFDDQTL